MAEKQFKKLAPTFAGSSFEQIVPVPVPAPAPTPVEVETPVVPSPQNPPCNLTEVRRQRDFQSRPSEEASAPALEPVGRERYHIDVSEISLLVELGKTGKNKSESENENGSKPCAAPANMADAADGAEVADGSYTSDVSGLADTSDLADTTELADASDVADGSDDSDGTIDLERFIDSDWPDDSVMADAAGAAGAAGPACVASRDVQVGESDMQLWPQEEEIYGMLHQYKPCRRTALNESGELNYVLGILNIPATMTRLNLHHFLAPFQETIDEIKIIRDTCASRYMAVIKFNAQEVMETFYTVYNGCSFNESSWEICQLVYVGKFEVLQPENEATFPTKGLIELPRCSKCLERTSQSMRSALVWLCDRSFECRSQDAPPCCPVCNYDQMAQEREKSCLECGIRESLHTCLICGFVGCGREEKGHANQHFNETKHAYGMQLNDWKVWDYAEDDYVHSDLQQCSDDMGRHERERREENLDPIQLEYSYLLTKHLESQQFFWEQKIIQLEKETNEEMTNMKARLISTTNKCDKLEYEVIDLLREKKAAEKKCALLSAEVVKLFNELKEEQEINNSLRSNKVLLQNQLEEEKRIMKETCEQIDIQISEIQDNLKDIILYLEEQQSAFSLSDENKEETQEEQIGTAVDAASSSPQEEELFQKDK